MAGAQLRWRCAITAALFGLLPLTILIPGNLALLCHSYTSIHPVFVDKINNDFSVATSIINNCSSSQTACVKAYLMLYTEKSGLLVQHRDCASEGLKDNSESITSVGQHLVIHYVALYCHDDLCNGEWTDLNDFKLPKQVQAESSSSNQCYSGVTLDPSQGIPDRVRCERDYTQCYHGNGTLTAGDLLVNFLVKTCDQSSCSVPESLSFGSMELKLWGSCCHGIFCNGNVAALENQNISKTVSTQNTTRPHEEDTVTQMTDFTKFDTGNDTQNVFPVPSVTHGHQLGIKTTTSPWNPLYDDEEAEDNPELAVGAKATLNPRAKGLGLPQPKLPFYLLMIALGIAILGGW